MDILTPPHDSWRSYETEEEKMDEETQKDTRQRCKRRTMHHVAINQMELKTEDPKKQTSSRNRSPENIQKQL